MPVAEKYGMVYVSMGAIWLPSARVSSTLSVRPDDGRVAERCLFQLLGRLACERQTRTAAFIRLNNPSADRASSRNEKEPRNWG